MKGYDKNKESSYIQYWDVNNLPVNWLSCKSTINFFYQYAKAYNEYMKEYDKNKESPYFQYWDEVKWVNNISNFDENFIKYYNEDSDK